MLVMPSLNRFGRAAGVQGQHHTIAIGLCIRPLPHDARAVRLQQALPAARGLPVAVVGVGQGGADDDDAQGIHGLFIAEHSETQSRAVALDKAPFFAFNSPFLIRINLKVLFDRSVFCRISTSMAILFHSGPFHDSL
jgi:hypothetical protein